MPKQTPLHRIRIKICGITRPEDGLAAAQAGADAIGLVFYEHSSRAVTIEQAQAVVAALPPFVTAVGLFVDPSPAWLAEVLASVPLGLLQFHGDESAELCARMGLPYLKAIRMRPEVDLAAAADTYQGAIGLLLDTYDPAAHGGTGAVFDWSRIPQQCSLPLVLAGGLHAENVGAAVAAAPLWAVDVSSGVERAKGIKDPERMAAFVAAVVAANQRRV